MREMRSCQPRVSSSRKAQRRPMPRGKAASRVATMRRRMAERVGFSSEKVQRAMRARRMPGVASERVKKRSW